MTASPPPVPQGDQAQPPVSELPPVLTAEQQLLLKVGAAAAIGIALVVMLCWTWGTWADILIDFGREIYTPWQLSQGQKLYHDIQFFNGPLSQYVNAMVFKVFGASFRVLVAWNIVVLAGLIVLLHWALRQIASWWAAAVACLVFVLVLACGRYTSIGNYNYVCPYSHEITHGVLLSILSLVLLWQMPRRGMLMAFLGGAALGLTFLTKIEVFLACAGATSAYLVLTLWTSRAPAGRWGKLIGTFGAGAIIPPLAALGLMSLTMPAKTAFAGIFGPVGQIFNSQVTQMKFYKWVMGTDYAGANLWMEIKWTLYYALFLGPLVLAALAFRGSSWQHRRLTCILGAIVAACIWFGRRLAPVVWFDLARPLPLIMAIMVAGLLILVVRERQGQEPPQRRIRQLSMAVLALMLMLKIVLAVHFNHYGFVLAMPATLLCVVLVLDWLPRRIDRAGCPGFVFAGPALAALAAAVAVHLEIQSYFLAEKNQPVSDPRGGLILTDNRAKRVHEVLDHLRAAAKPGQTLAVLPEGVMINYLADMRNPTPYINFMPPEMVIFGEGKMIGAFRAHPPDFILLLDRDVDEYGFKAFGQDYAPELYRWIIGKYSPLWQETTKQGKMKAQLLQKSPM
jgi:hypothetical protein